MYESPSKEFLLDTIHRWLVIRDHHSLSCEYSSIEVYEMDIGAVPESMELNVTLFAGELNPAVGSSSAV